MQKKRPAAAASEGPTGKSRGLVKNPELLHGGREVLGGAPSTGHRS